MTYVKSATEESDAALGGLGLRVLGLRGLGLRGLGRKGWGRKAGALLVCLLSAGILPAFGMALEPGSDLELSQKAVGQKKGAAKKDKVGKKALIAAGKLSRLPKGTSQKLRNERLAKALDAYAAIEMQKTRSRKNRAEAAFRSGQILGRLGRAEESVPAFRRAAKLESELFGARALFEAGNVERRLKHYAQALELYRQAARKRTKSKRAKKPVSATNIKYAERAKFEVGTALRYLGRLADARRQWKKLGQDKSVDPFLRIRAFDGLAMSFLAEKNYEKAKNVLDEGSDALAAECAGDDKKAKSLRRRLERMRARKGLARWRAAKKKGN